MTIAKAVLALVCLMPVRLGPKEAKVTPLSSKDMADIPGKEGLMIARNKTLLSHRSGSHLPQDIYLEGLL
jgi:hypothetical protein